MTKDQALRDIFKAISKTTETAMNEEFDALIDGLTYSQLFAAARLYSQLRNEDVRQGRAQLAFDAVNDRNLYLLQNSRTVRLAVLNALGR
jgi:hypothetical protein